MLIEVLVSAMVLVVVVIGALGGFDAVGRASVSDRSYNQATSVAQQDEESLRGTPIATILSTAGAANYQTVVYGGTTFHVYHTAAYESDTTNGTPCSTSGTSSADYLRTDSYVTWASMPHGGYNSTTPVTESSIVNPPETAALVVHDTDWGGNAIAGTQVQVANQAGTTVATGTTDSNGCAIFTTLTDGTYNVTLLGAPDIDQNRVTNPVKPVTVVTGVSTPLTFTYTPPAYITATFKTNDMSGNWITAGVAGDSFTVYNPSTIPLGTTYSFAPTAPSGPPLYTSVPTTSPGLFPFNYINYAATGDPVAGSNYYAYAGTCSADDPAGLDSTYSDAQVTLLPTNTATNPASVQVDLPPLVIKQVNGAGGVPVTSANAPKDVHVTDGCGVTRVYNSSALHSLPYSGTAGLLLNPDLPAGTYKCASI